MEADLSLHGSLIILKVYCKAVSDKTGSSRDGEHMHGSFTSPWFPHSTGMESLHSKYTPHGCLLLTFLVCSSAKFSAGWRI